MSLRVDASQDRNVAFAAALSVLGSPARLALLQQLRSPKLIRALEVEGGERLGSGRAHKISRQAVREHLERLIEIGVVVSRETAADGAIEYIINHQKLFAISEEFRALARLRAAEEPEGRTIREGPAPPARFRIEGPCLVLVKGLDEGRAFALNAAGPSEWVIGRRRGLPVSLDFDPFVSTEHACIVHEDGAFFVRDLLDSSNGTTLNFQLLPKGVRHNLSHGDVVGVGRSLLLFHA